MSDYYISVGKAGTACVKQAGLVVQKACGCGVEAGMGDQVGRKIGCGGHERILGEERMRARLAPGGPGVTSSRQGAAGF